MCPNSPPPPASSEKCSGQMQNPLVLHLPMVVWDHQSTADGSAARVARSSDTVRCSPSGDRWPAAPSPTCPVAGSNCHHTKIRWKSSPACGRRHSSCRAPCSWLRWNRARRPWHALPRQQCQRRSPAAPISENSGTFAATHWPLSPPWKLVPPASVRRTNRFGKEQANRTIGKQPYGSTLFAPRPGSCGPSWMAKPPAIARLAGRAAEKRGFGHVLRRGPMEPAAAAQLVLPTGPARLIDFSPRPAVLVTTSCAAGLTGLSPRQRTMSNNLHHFEIGACSPPYSVAATRDKNSPEFVAVPFAIASSCPVFEPCHVPLILKLVPPGPPVRARRIQQELDHQPKISFHCRVFLLGFCSSHRMRPISAPLGRCSTKFRFSGPPSQKASNKYPFTRGKQHRFSCANSLRGIYENLALRYLCARREHGAVPPDTKHPPPDPVCPCCRDSTRANALDGAPASSSRPVNAPALPEMKKLRPVRYPVVAGRPRPRRRSGHRG